MRNIVILGGGSAGFLTALSMKTRIPELSVTVLRSAEIGIIGVGEGSVPDLLDHLHGECQIPPDRFYAEAKPSLKLGVHFIWGPRKSFNYTFSACLTGREPVLPKERAYYGWEDMEEMDVYSSMMSRNKVFERLENGAPSVLKTVGYHLENVDFVSSLERYALERGVVIKEGKVAGVVKGECREMQQPGVRELVLETGERVTADLFVDCSGFVSKLLGETLEEPFISYRDSLFCDRAVVGGWDRTTEPILPYTIAETMDAGWCWQIEHQNRINRGYVYSSDFLSDEQAAEEFTRKNPKVTRTRIVPFVSGRRRRSWVGNVVAIGNASGFVEPLEATAMLVICQQARALTRVLKTTDFQPGPAVVASYNRLLSRSWDEIRDFLAIHYRYNTRLETPFWKAATNEVAIHQAQPIVESYQEYGPSTLMINDLLPPSVSMFQLEGFYALLVGQKVPFRQAIPTGPKEREIWEQVKRRNAAAAMKAMTVEETLAIFQHPGWSWTPGFYGT